MKATRASLLGEFTGKLDGLIYYRSKLTGKLYVRRCWKFENHPAAPAFRDATKAIFALNPSQAYRNNLRDYIGAYNRLPAYAHKPMGAWTNAYNKLMFAMQKAYPELVDLRSINREQIESLGLPCRTVKDAVEAGLLPKVADYERFTAAL